EPLLDGGEQAAGLRVGLRGDDVHADHRVRRVELTRGLEGLAVDLERGQQEVRRKVRGERVRQAQEGRELGAERARPEDPQRIVEVPAAMWPITTAVAALAIPGMLWCSATQYRR